jgi:hypothetical protein
MSQYCDFLRVLLKEIVRSENIIEEAIRKAIEASQGMIITDS